MAHLVPGTGAAEQVVSSGNAGLSDRDLARLVRALGARGDQHLHFHDVAVEPQAMAATVAWHQAHTG